MLNNALLVLLDISDVGHFANDGQDAKGHSLKFDKGVAYSNQAYWIQGEGTRSGIDYALRQFRYHAIARIHMHYSWDLHHIPHAAEPLVKLTFDEMDLHFLANRCPCQL